MTLDPSSPGPSLHMAAGTAMCPTAHCLLPGCSPPTPSILPFLVSSFYCSQTGLSEMQVSLLLKNCHELLVAQKSETRPCYWAPRCFPTDTTLWPLLTVAPQPAPCLSLCMLAFSQPLVSGPPSHRTFACAVSVLCHPLSAS